MTLAPSSILEANLAGGRWSTSFSWCHRPRQYSAEENWSKSGIEAGGGTVVAFAKCRSTERRVRLAYAEVLKNLKYEFLTQNCQTFVIKVLK